MFILVTHVIASYQSTVAFRHRIERMSMTDQRTLSINHYLPLVVCAFTIVSYLTASLSSLLAELHIPSCFCSVLPYIINNTVLLGRSSSYYFFLIRAERAQGTTICGRAIPSKRIIFRLIFPLSLLLSLCLMTLVVNWDSIFESWAGVCAYFDAEAGGCQWVMSDDFLLLSYMGPFIDVAFCALFSYLFYTPILKMANLSLKDVVGANDHENGIRAERAQGTTICGRAIPSKRIIFRLIFPLSLLLSLCLMTLVVNWDSIFESWAGVCAYFDAEAGGCQWVMSDDFLLLSYMGPFIDVAFCALFSYLFYTPILKMANLSLKDVVGANDHENGTGSPKTKEEVIFILKFSLVLALVSIVSSTACFFIFASFPEFWWIWSVDQPVNSLCTTLMMSHYRKVLRRLLCKTTQKRRERATMSNGMHIEASAGTYTIPTINPLKGLRVVSIQKSYMCIQVGPVDFVDERIQTTFDIMVWSDDS